MSSTALRQDARRGRIFAWASYTIAAWRSITRREWLVALAIGAFSAVMNVLMSLELLSKLEYLGALAQITFWVVLTGVVGLLAWALADRADAPGSDQPGTRRRRMAAALVGAALVSSLALPLFVYEVLRVPAPIVMFGTKESHEMPPLWVLQTRITVMTLIFGGLAFGLVEAHRQRRMADAALSVLQRKREELARRALEARLAAMQAQVEPRFLFDSLVDIDALYRRDPSQAASMLDRLITYLRVALPQLRDTGSTAQAEADLVAAYLSVVAARHQGLPRTQVVVESDASELRFYPMLLLPLVQRAVRAADADPARLPRAVQLVMKRQGDTLVALLRIDAPHQCDNDAELERLRERIAALYGDRAALACAESARGVSEFSLRIPHESARLHDRSDRGRR